MCLRYTTKVTYDRNSGFAVQQPYERKTTVLAWFGNSTHCGPVTSFVDRNQNYQGLLISNFDLKYPFGELYQTWVVTIKAGTECVFVVSLSSELVTQHLTILK